MTKTTATSDDTRVSARPISISWPTTVMFTLALMDERYFVVLVPQDPGPLELDDGAWLVVDELVDEPLLPEVDDPDVPLCCPLPPAVPFPPCI